MADLDLPTSIEKYQCDIEHIDHKLQMLVRSKYTSEQPFQCLLNLEEGCDNIDTTLHNRIAEASNKLQATEVREELKSLRTIQRQAKEVFKSIQKARNGYKLRCQREEEGMALKRGVEQRKRIRKSDKDEEDTSIPPKRLVRVVNTKILAIRLASLHKLNTAEIKHANTIPQVERSDRSMYEEGLAHVPSQEGENR